jgi:hypothetical protein
MSIIRLTVMTDPQYRKILLKEIQKLRSLIQRRDDTELDISKTRQFVRATVNMLPDDERQKMERLLVYVDNSDSGKRAGLADAIRSVLEHSAKRWFTVAQVRDALRDSGFDFSGYTSNPLSSVSTTLKRLKSPNIESTEIDDVTAYRCKKAPKKRRSDNAGMQAALASLGIGEAQIAPLTTEEIDFDAVDSDGENEG